MVVAVGNPFVMAATGSNVRGFVGSIGCVVGTAVVCVGMPIFIRPESIQSPVDPTPFNTAVAGFIIGIDDNGVGCVGNGGINDVGGTPKPVVVAVAASNSICVGGQSVTVTCLGSCMRKTSIGPFLLDSWIS